MIKGYQREMIVMHTEGSPVFEHAYFVLKRREPPLPEADMLTEANRLIGAGEGYARGRRSRPHHPWRLFFLGFLLGAGLCALMGVWLFP